MSEIETQCLADSSVCVPHKYVLWNAPYILWCLCTKQICFMECTLHLMVSVYHKNVLWNAPYILWRLCTTEICFMECTLHLMVPVYQNKYVLWNACYILWCLYTTQICFMECTLHLMVSVYHTNMFYGMHRTSYGVCVPHKYVLWNAPYILWCLCTTQIRFMECTLHLMVSVYHTDMFYGMRLTFYGACVPHRYVLWNAPYILWYRIQSGQDVN
jgi:hypothetical protein